MFFITVVVLVIAGFAFTSNGYGVLGIPMIALGGWMLWRFVTEMKNKSASKSEWSSLIANAQYHHFQDHSGIAIDTKEKIVHLKHPSQIKSYPFSDIRSWRYNLSTGGHVRTYGAIGGIAAAQASAENIRVMRENKASSGFYVTVKDIENPEWRVAMNSEKDMKKWMEIFEQHVNEN